MEIRHLRYFLTLAKELSFTKASEKLFIAQPPLSRQIKELELELGTPLFNRNNKKVVLTEAGKYYQKEISQLLQTLDRINLKTQKMGQHISGEFRIAYISSTFSGDITELVKFLSSKYPFVNFRLYEVPTVEQVIGLEQGKIDLGIIRAPLYSHQIE
ncbi:MAG: LysR family transcriptional regulator, partial [Sphingobacteriia bacterium 35-40-8]